MIKVKDTEKLQENIIELLDFALRHEFIDRELVDIFTSGITGPLIRSDLEALVREVQAFFKQPVYTTDQAAAWLGVGIDSVRDAVFRDKTLRSMKPGHDRLITHGWLVEYRDNGKGE